MQRTEAQIAEDRQKMQKEKGMLTDSLMVVARRVGWTNAPFCGFTEKRQAAREETSRQRQALDATWND